MLHRARLLVSLVVALWVLLPFASPASAQALRVGYSDWPGWVAYEIAKEKGFFRKHGVEVDLVWMDYVPSMDAFAAGRLDGVGMTNGDALVVGANSAKPSVAILINDYSNGNDMIVARSGIDSVRDLKGKKVGVEVGFVTHLLLLKALESNGLTESDVELVNVPTNETPQALAAGGVDAIAAWQPSSGQALATVSGSKAIYTSAEVPGLIYDNLYVSPESLRARRDDWLNVVRAWYDVTDYMADPANREEMLGILAARVGVRPEEYARFLDGSKILPIDRALKVMTGPEDAGLDSLVGSSRVADEFNVKYGVYEKPEFRSRYFDASLKTEVAKERGVSIPGE